MIKRNFMKSGLFIAPVVLGLFGCSATQTASGPADSGPPNTPQTQPGLTLKDAYKDAFRIGVALNNSQIDERDTAGDALVVAQFNSISPENILKWEVVHPKPGVYDFTEADKYVAFGEKHHMQIIGHNLVWHSQTPAWVFKDDKGGQISREALLDRLREHVQTVVGRYKGRIFGWDVVNEVLNEDGTLRQSNWLKIIGDDYIEKAFQFAHEVDPNAELYYNDYSIENPVKRKGAVALIKKLQAHGVPITGIGLQGHDHLDFPSLADQAATIEAFKQLGIKVAITELDIDVLPQVSAQATADVSLHMAADPKFNPYPNSLPDSVQQELAKRYADLFGVFLKYRGTVTRVTFWNVTDGDFWLNDWPIRGRSSYPLLFDRHDQPKPAFQAVLQAASVLPPKQ